MKTSKILMIVGGVVLAFVLLIGIMFAGIWRMTSGPADAATEFFTTIAKSGPQAAYQSTSPAFQQAASFDAFTAIVDRGHLTRFTSATWSNRQIVNGNAHVEGTVTVDSAPLPAKLDLVRGSSGKWQVLNFDIKLPGATAQPAAATGNGTGGVASQAPLAAAPSASNAAGGQVSSMLGNRAWTVGAKSVLTIRLGDMVTLTTAPVVKGGNIDTTALTLQFNPSTSGVQTLGRECVLSQPCIMLMVDGNQYKLDTGSSYPATLRVTNATSTQVEGDFSADMVSLDGKLPIRNGHFVATLGGK